MNTSSELQSTYDEVLKKIGRNLLLFQQAEQILKTFLTLGSFKTTSDKPGQFLELADVWNKQTMGQLRSQFIARHCTTSENPFSDFCPDSAGIAVAVTLGSSIDFAEQRRSGIDGLVAERNDLVHHLLLRLDRNSLGSCRKVADELDSQRLRILPEIHLLQQDLTDVQAGFESILKYLSSSKGMDALYLPELQQSPLIQNLVTIAGDSTDPEGWTPLGPATKRLEDFPKEKIDSLLAQFGQKSLTCLLTASEFFETRQESVKKGSHRTLFRLKPKNQAETEATL